jgi:hypothetical protein
MTDRTGHFVSRQSDHLRRPDMWVGFPESARNYSTNPRVAPNLAPACSCGRTYTR